MPEAQTSTFEHLDPKALAGFIVEKNREVQQFIKAVGGKWDADKLAIMKSRTAEIEAAQARKDTLDEVQITVDRLVAQQKALEGVPEENRIPFQTNGGNGNAGQPPQQQKAVKSLGEMFTESRAYKEVGSHDLGVRSPYSVMIPDIDFQNTVKTVMTTAAGYAPPNDRTGIVVPYAQREPRLADLIPSDPTMNSSIKYMEETTALAGTLAQVTITEGNLKFENTLAFTERTSPVETIGTWLPVTTQQLDDVPGIQGIINNRLTTFLQLVEEDLLLNGNGTPPQISGFLDRAIGTQARGVDNNIDCVFKAMQACRVSGFAEPDGVVMHPSNLTPIATYKSTAGDYGFNPLTENGGVLRLWGKPLILTTAITAGTALVGAFRLYSHISRKMGMTIQVGLNADDFTKNKRTILGEFRESLEVYRVLAFTQCTGLQ